jgi:hypothetical protein
MPLKVLPVIPSQQEDAAKQNVSLARGPGAGDELHSDDYEGRLGRLLARLAAGVAFSPARAKAICDGVKRSRGE